MRGPCVPTIGIRAQEHVNLLITGSCDDAEDCFFQVRGGSDTAVAGLDQDELSSMVYDDGVLFGSARMVGCHRERRNSMKDG